MVVNRRSRHQCLCWLQVYCIQKWALYQPDVIKIIITLLVRIVVCNVFFILLSNRNASMVLWHTVSHKDGSVISRTIIGKSVICYFQFFFFCLFLVFFYYNVIRILVNLSLLMFQVVFFRWLSFTYASCDTHPT